MTVGELVERLAGWIERLMPAGERRDRLVVEVRERFGGEALAYHLQARGRVTVVGERTPGAADHITPIRLGPSVLGLLPEAYVMDSRTGTNWEGRGVVPDVSCPAGEAVAAALSVIETRRTDCPKSSTDLAARRVP